MRCEGNERREGHVGMQEHTARAVMTLSLHQPPDDLDPLMHANSLGLVFLHFCQRQCNLS